MKRLSHALAVVLLALLVAARGYAGFGTTVPVSAEAATNIARSLFPVTLKVDAGNLFLTDPVVIFIDDKRIGLQARFQAYDNRPQQGVVVSEEGQILVSGEVGYDPRTGQILLYEPGIDELAFDMHSDTTARLRVQVLAAWEAQVSNPIRAPLPPHPFITPFKAGIQNVSYDKRSISIEVWYP